MVVAVRKPAISQIFVAVWIAIIVTLLTPPPPPSLGQQLACGFPGSPANGSVSAAGGSAFTLNATVTYSCSTGFILFGEEKRTCRKNGTWSSDIPICDSNVARNKYATQSGQLRQQKAGLAVDGDPTTCSSTPKTPSERWWQLSLGQSYQVTMVAVTISIGIWHKFSIYVVNAEGDNRIVYNLCGAYEGTFEFSMVEIKCGNGTGQVGEYVFIRDNRPGTFQLSLCEVEVFAYREDRPCGDPEIPLHGTVRRVNETTSEYGCQPGFTLRGPSIFRCIDSVWESPPPACGELYCQAPPPIRGARFTPIYAEWFATSDKTHYPFGTVLNYTCEWDFVTEMVGALVCSDHAAWVGTHPICLPTDCGPPPIVPYATFRFLNESRPTKTESMVELHCHDGFHRTEGNPISRCLRGGNWSSINSTCRVLANENLKEESLQPALGAALAIVLILVVVLFVVLVIMFLRRGGHLKRSIPMLARSSTEGSDHCPHLQHRHHNHHHQQQHLANGVLPPVYMTTTSTMSTTMTNGKHQGPNDVQDLYDDVWPSDETSAGDAIEDALYTDAVSSTEDLAYDGSTDRIYDHPEGGCIEEGDGEEEKVSVEDAIRERDKDKDKSVDEDEDHDHVYYSPLEGINEELKSQSNCTSERSQLPPADGAPESTFELAATIKDGPPAHKDSTEDAEHIYEPLRRSSSPTFPLKPVYAKVDLALKKQRRHRSNRRDMADSASASSDDDCGSGPFLDGDDEKSSRPQPEGIVTYTVPLFGGGGGGNVAAAAAAAAGSPTRPGSTSTSGPTTPTTPTGASLQRPLPPIPSPAVGGVAGSDSVSLASTVMVDNSLYGQRNSWGLVAENDLYDGTAAHGKRSATPATTC